MRKIRLVRRGIARTWPRLPAFAHMERRIARGAIEGDMPQSPFDVIAFDGPDCPGSGDGRRSVLWLGVPGSAQIRPSATGNLND